MTFEVIFLVALLGTVVLLPCVLMARRERLPSLLAVGVPALMALLWFATRPVASGDDWRLPFRGAEMLLVLVTLVACAVRLARVRNSEAGEAPLDWFPTRVSLVATALVAAGWLAGDDAARIIEPGYLMVLGVMVAGGLLLATVGASRRGRILLCVLSGVLVAGLAGILVWPSRIVTAAEMAADGRAYCMLVPDGGDGHRLARSLADLTPLVMRASQSGLRVTNNNGQLHVDGSPPMHWSFASGRFEPNADTFGEAPCRKKAHFGADLWWR
ncbi:hypothetical protein BH10PSE13_BH10PSE13_10890 [soil metagenome]